MAAQQTKDFGLKELLNIFDVESAVGNKKILTAQMVKVYTKNRVVERSAYTPKWYMMLPTGAIMTYFTNGQIKSKLNSPLLLSLKLGKITQQSIWPKNIKRYDIEVMTTDDVSDGYWNLTYLTWTRDNKIQFGNSKLLIKK